jgi:hypothetical protein
LEPTSPTPFEAFISPLVIEEASRGDETAARLRLEKIAGFSILEINEEVRRLAELYFERIQIAEKAKGISTPLICTPEELLETWNEGRSDCGRGACNTPSA